MKYYIDKTKVECCKHNCCKSITSTHFIVICHFDFIYSSHAFYLFFLMPPKTSKLLREQIKELQLQNDEQFEQIEGQYLRMNEKDQCIKKLKIDINLLKDEMESIRQLRNYYLRENQKLQQTQKDLKAEIEELKFMLKHQDDFKMDLSFY